MKQQIDHLIANHLLDEGEVYLPKVGTLILSRHAAKLLSAKQLQRPYRELRITAEERGESIVTHIARIAKLSDERANDIYNEWLAQSQRNDTVTIGELCTIEKGKVTTDKTFELMANPQGRGTMKVNPRTNYLIYIIAGVCIGFAVGIAGYILHSNGTFDNLFAKDKVAPPSAAFENIAEQPAPVTEPVVEVPEAVAAEVQPTEEVTTPSEVIAIPMQRGSSYAVWGVYSELKNAEAAKAMLGNKHPEIGAEIYQYDGRYMVALCEVASRSECARNVTAWKAQSTIFKEVWVYTR